MKAGSNLRLPRRAFVAGLLAAGLAEAAAPRAGRARWQGPERRGSGWLEWRLPVPPGASSGPFFDPTQHDAGCSFTGPGGERLRVTAFFSDDEHGRGWRLRLLPPRSGRWRGVPQQRLRGGALQPLGEPFSFDVAEVPAHARIGLDPRNPRYFAFTDDGSPFVPVGLNLCWAVGPNALDDYRRWFRRLAAGGGNFARLWMASWAFGIEWDDTGLGDYTARQDRAALLDAVFELAEAHGIRLMLCLLNHGAFSDRADTEWRHNPYSRVNGGPLGAAADFVTDERAMALFERRLRYIAARWSHSPALHSWEWWNEVTWTPMQPAALRRWIVRMSRVLDRHDPYRRLRSTSWADRGDVQAWQLPELDYAQQHDYTRQDPLRHYAEAARAWAADGVHAKPLVAGELGLETTYDAQAPRPFDAEAVHLFNGLWAPLFHGYAGTALHWWWDSLVDPLDLWPLYRGVARWLQALHAAGLSLGEHRPHAAALDGGPAQALALAGARSLLVWVRADLHEAGALRRAWVAETGGSDATRRWQPRYPRLDACRVRLQGLALPEGRVAVRWLDAESGEPVADQAARVEGGVLSLACPPFERSLAAIVTGPVA